MPSSPSVFLIVVMNLITSTTGMISTAGRYHSFFFFFYQYVIRCNISEHYTSHYNFYRLSLIVTSVKLCILTANVTLECHISCDILTILMLVFSCACWLHHENCIALLHCRGIYNFSLKCIHWSPLGTPV